MNELFFQPYFKLIRDEDDRVYMGDWSVVTRKGKRGICITLDTSRQEGAQIADHAGVGLVFIDVHYKKIASVAKHLYPSYI